MIKQNNLHLKQFPFVLCLFVPAVGGTVAGTPRPLRRSCTCSACFKLFVHIVAAPFHFASGGLRFGQARCIIRIHVNSTRLPKLF
jgi:hypothetical protein